MEKGCLKFTNIKTSKVLPVDKGLHEFRVSLFFYGQSLIPKIHGPCSGNGDPNHRGRLAVWVVVGKLARALAGPALAGSVHKAVGFVGKAYRGACMRG
jgi:hypothetical protein